MPIPMMRSFEFADSEALKERYHKLGAFPFGLADETLLIAAAVSLNLCIREAEWADFLERLELVQRGMPGGVLRSRQIISMVGTEFV